MIVPCRATRRGAPIDTTHSEDSRAFTDSAFEDLYHQHYATVYRLLYRMVGDEADDLAQEVFCRLYWQPPDESGNLRAWLCRVATNLGYNHLRSQRRRRHWEDIFERARRLAGSADTITRLDVSAERQDDCDSARRVLSSLRRRDAQILVLRYSGLTYREIARVTGIAQGSVGTLLSRAERAFGAAYVSMYGGAGEGE